MLHKTFVNDEVYPQAEQKVMDFIMAMNQFSREEYIDKYRNDVHFHNGVRALIQIFVVAEV